MTVEIEQAQTSLKELIARTVQGEKVLITDGCQPVAELVAVRPAKPKPVFGSCKGMLTILSEDKEHLKDFEDYIK